MRLSAIVLIVMFLSGTIRAESPAKCSEKTIDEYSLELLDPPKGRVWRRFDNKTGSFSLVLSGGGARGLAQIGVLEVLEENGLRPNLVVGVSMGAIVGGLYSAGYTPAQMREILKKTRWNDLIYDSPKRTKLFQTQRMATEKFLLHLRFRNFRPYIPEGISAAQMISTLLIMQCAAPNYAADGDFDRLAIPFRTVATDLRTGAPVVFKGGDLAVALRASSAIPLFLAPIENEGDLLADGGLNYPIPVEIAKAISDDKIVAVDATADLEYPHELDNALLILDQTTTIMSEDKKKYERKLADIVIKPDLTNRGSYDFDQLDSLIEAGRAATVDRVQEIEALPEQDLPVEQRYCIAKITSSAPLEIVEGDSITLSDLQTIAADVYSEGIYSGVKIAYSLAKDSIELEIVTELNRPLIAVKFSGVRSVDSDSLESLFEIDSLKPANLMQIDSILTHIERGFKDEGFDLAHISFAAFDGGALGVIFDEGIIEKVEISGNKRTKDWLIRSYSSFKIGQKFENARLENAINNLHATNLFESVIPKLERGDSSAVVKLQLVEKPYFGIRLGSRFDVVNGVEGAIEVGDDNLFGIAWRLNCGVSGGGRRWATYARTETDRIAYSFLTGSATLFAQGTEFDIWADDTVSETHSLNFYGLKLSLGQQIKRFGTVFVEVGSEYVEFGPERTNLKEYPLNRLTIRSLVDTFDDKQFPKDGKYHESYYMMSQDILGGEFSFTKAYAGFQSYWTWSDPITFHPYAIGGFATGGLPYFEQFELGQDMPFWGFRGDERRGNSLFKAGFDLRANPMDPVFIYAGVACGRTWQKDDKLHLDELIWGWGAGWGIATPLGPLKLYWGTNTEKLQQIDFSLGYNFD